MYFDQVVGQDRAKDLIREYIQRGRLPHAILLTGKEGWGGLPLSIALARILVCDAPLDGNSCGQCADCQMMDRLEHPDVHLSFPVISLKPGQKPLPSLFMAEFRQFFSQNPYGSSYDWLQFLGAENKQGNLSAESCREMLSNLVLKTLRGKYKVQIIWMAEYLGKEGNILLKLIEEPPANTCIVLVAAEGQHVLDTIRSRTQEIRLKPLEPEQIRQGLMRVRPDLDEDQSMALSRLAAGEFSEALRLAKDNTEPLLEEVRNWFNHLFRRKGWGIYQFVDQWSKRGREQQKQFLSYCIDLMGHGFRQRYVTDNQGGLSPRERAFVQKLSAMDMDSETFMEISEELAQTRYRIERNAHAKTQFHALSIRLQRHLLQKPNQKV